MTDTVAVYLFAKAPLEGRVKTRMQPFLTPSESLALHSDLLQLACHNLSALERSEYQLELHVSAHHPIFDELAARHTIPIRLQRGANLGARMSHAVRQGLIAHRAVILIGADCPSMDAHWVQQIAKALQRVQAVVVPALDGGYVALGLTRHAPELFCNMPWGGAEVAAQTRQRLQALGWHFDYLAEQADIDRPEDLKYLRDKLDGWAERAP